MDYILGETNEDFTIETVDENREMILAMVKQAKHTINIFSQDLDDHLYDNLELKELLTAFVMNNVGGPQVRILVKDMSHAIHNSHRLIALSQTLSSFVFIRKPCDVFQSEKSEFITVDGVGVIHRPSGEHGNYHAAVNFNMPPRAQELRHFFTEVWEQSEVEPHTRQLMI